MQKKPVYIKFFMAFVCSCSSGFLYVRTFFPLWREPQKGRTCVCTKSLLGELCTQREETECLAKNSIKTQEGGLPCAQV